MTLLIPRTRLLALLALTLAPALAGAQGRSAPVREDHVATTDPSVTIPRSMVPPAGKCRIWMRDVPPAQQPAPTDCTTALRQAPANGVLVFGPALRDLSPFEARSAASDLARERERERERARGRSRGDSSSGSGGAGNGSSTSREGTTVTTPRREAEARQPETTRRPVPARPATPTATPAPTPTATPKQGTERPTGGSKPPTTKKPE